MLRKVIPLADRVLVKRIMAAKTTPGGIILPEANVGKSNEGEVVSVGKGRFMHDGKLLPMNLVAGDKVLLPDFGGVAVKDGDDEMFLFREDEILAKIEK
mmetsp:Transcript_64323/g.139128  ORF Transcript_64323/g.139128 Transcript_64323/m.139128 type:complete len:99 (+) Transcript_64323:33-329(+)|eukprot:CAMPEP_0116955326 /NCGR_PEP_ID=MMETSP0467-20121206/42546_1 /TAXON_ID=283647 /ORGANISM="Mesodinium pulex, Strain SPMC105" /LENGTH=98 /DNA_ID=CAMNT_0004641337 /DNA_START=30 /DNA_END=326 /DNA_ORIENTATION=-